MKAWQSLGAVICHCERMGLGSVYAQRSALPPPLSRATLGSKCLGDRRRDSLILEPRDGALQTHIRVYDRMTINTVLGEYGIRRLEFQANQSPFQGLEIWNVEVRA
jgi:hypothetical protein